ncbi:MAG: 7-cyano-7-deazaguanine synthase [Planctomycetota bacterium]|nr:7-cyano-7-deazaguanine synthase [Planctomycetota bacterium]
MAQLSPILVLDRGDLSSLCATLLDPNPERLILWHVRETDSAANRRLQACQAKAKAMGVKRLITSEPLELGLKGMTPPAELYQAMVLIQGAAIARQLKCDRIIWPRQVGPDFERMGELVDRASQIADLASGGKEDKKIVIDLPLVDLTDEYMVDLIEEAAGPLELFWPCDEGGAAPCGECRSCQRWQGAFEAMGVAWPWVGAMA